MADIRSVLIVDTETNGDDATRHVAIEVAAVLWSVPYRCAIASVAALLPANINEAYPVNRIPTHALVEVTEGDAGRAWEAVAALAERADAITAYNAEFDRPFVGTRLPTKPWFCSMDDLAWGVVEPRMPDAAPRVSLVNRALGFGLGVGTAHRAIEDCLLLGRLFARVGEQMDLNGAHGKLQLDLDTWIAAGVRRGAEPRVRVVSLAPFEQKDVVKKHGFSWDSGRRVWWRTMIKSEIADLPFRVREETT